MASGPDSVGNETIAHLTAMYEEHGRSASQIQRVANRATALIAKPLSLTIIVVFIAVYMTGNLIARSMGSATLEEFPFPDLEFIATIVALVVALLILTTQRHEEALAERRARLTLQIAAISERKIAKVIELLEEQRRDNPLLETRDDAEAESMAVPANPDATLRQIDEVRLPG